MKDTTLEEILKRKLDTSTLKILRIKTRCPFCLGSGGTIGTDEVGNYAERICHTCEGYGYNNTIIYCDDYEEYTVDSLKKGFKTSRYPNG